MLPVGSDPECDRPVKGAESCLKVTTVTCPITGKERLQHVKVRISPIPKPNPFVTSDESSPEASTSSVGATSSLEGACAVFASTPVSPPSSIDALGSTAALIGMESSTQTDPSYRHDYAGRPLSPPPRYDLIDARRNIYSDLDSDSEPETEELDLAGPEPISGSIRDMSLVPQRLQEPFRRIAPLPAGLTPPLMPRVTNYAWAGAGDWEEAAGIGETIRTNSPWSSLEGSVIEDLLRPLTSFADVRRYVTLDPFIDDDDDDVRSVDSYGRALTPIQRDPEEMHERGRARPDAQPPQPEPILPRGLLQEVAVAVGGARRRVPLQRVETGTFNFV